MKRALRRFLTDAFVLLLSILILIVFAVLPWYDIGVEVEAGPLSLTVGESATGLSVLLASVGAGGDEWLRQARALPVEVLPNDVAIFAIPAAAIIAALLSLSNIFRPARFMKRLFVMMMGIMGLLYYVSFFVQNESIGGALPAVDFYPADIVGAGFWLCFAGMVALVLQVFLPRPRN